VHGEADMHAIVMAAMGDASKPVNVWLGLEHCGGTATNKTSWKWTDGTAFDYDLWHPIGYPTGRYGRARLLANTGDRNLNTYYSDYFGNDKLTIVCEKRMM